MMKLSGRVSFDKDKLDHEQINTLENFLSQVSDGRIHVEEEEDYLNVGINVIHFEYNSYSNKKILEKTLKELMENKKYKKALISISLNLNGRDRKKDKVYTYRYVPSNVYGIRVSKITTEYRSYML